ncbi:MAG: hypothetical protein AB1468_03935 [Candidatus Micrarchaeota archaeon]
MTIQAHITVICSDAREFGPIRDKAIKQLVDEYAVRGIEVKYMELSTPGTVMTPGKCEDIVNAAIRTIGKYGPDTDMNMHFLTHGGVIRTREFKDGVFSRHGITVDLNSPYTCGMTKAVDVAVEIEKMLLEAGRVKFKGKEIRIESLDDVPGMLELVYGDKVSLAGEWIQNLQPLPIHIAAQRDEVIKALEKAGLPVYKEGDNGGRKANGIRVTASVQDYSDYTLYRVDGMNSVRSFFDDVYERASIILKNMDESGREAYVGARTGKQSPEFVLIHSPFIKNARMLAAKIILEREPKAGDVFAMCGFDVSNNSGYDKAGLAYALWHLKAPNVYVWGKNDKETQTIIKKLEADPLDMMILERAGVKLKSFWDFVGMKNMDEFKEKNRILMQLGSGGGGGSAGNAKNRGKLHI